MLGTPCPKDRPHALVKREREAALKAKDQAQNRKVKLRAQGRCEVREQTYWTDPRVLPQAIRLRCQRAPVGDPHHLKGGYGRRNRGDSVLASQKIAVCRRCHSEITQNILVPLDKQADALHVIYRRVR
jgi:hypothetical protein